MRVKFKVRTISRPCPGGPVFAEGQTYDLPDVWAEQFIAGGKAEKATILPKKKAKKDKE